MPTRVFVEHPVTGDHSGRVLRNVRAWQVRLIRRVPVGGSSAGDLRAAVTALTRQSCGEVGAGSGKLGADRENEVRDPFALDADGRVAELGAFFREPTEEGAVALAHHDRDQVDGYFVHPAPAQVEGVTVSPPTGSVNLSNVNAWAGSNLHRDAWCSR